MDHNQPNEESNRKAKLADLLKSLTEYKKVFGDHESLSDFETKLGLPDKIETTYEDGFEIVTKYWYQQDKDFSICYVTPLNNIDIAELELKRFSMVIKEVDDNVLNTLLEQSLEREDYESAVLIRDEIKSRKKYF